MRTSERATASIRQMPRSEHSWAERYRLAGEDWVDKDAAARLLEDTKATVLSQMINAAQPMPVDALAACLVDAREIGATTVAAALDDTLGDFGNNGMQGVHG